jgi:hypothetical protein
VDRWLRALALFAALTAGSAPAIAMPIERAAACDVRGLEEREQRTTAPQVEARSLAVFRPLITPRPITTERLLLVPDLYLRHCALLR